MAEEGKEALGREALAKIRSMIDFARAGRRYQYADIRAGVLRGLLAHVPTEYEVEMRLDDLEKLIECAETRIPLHSLDEKDKS